MLCNRIFDFVTGTEVVLAGPPSGTPQDFEAERALWDILRPNPAAEALIAQHVETLLSRMPPRSA